MSGAATGNPATTKATVSDNKDDSKPLAPQKPAAQLEEDDEFEDFPVEGKAIARSLRTSRSRKRDRRGDFVEMAISADTEFRLGQGRRGRRASGAYAFVGGELG